MYEERACPICGQEYGPSGKCCGRYILPKPRPHTPPPPVQLMLDLQPETPPPPKPPAPPEPTPVWVIDPPHPPVTVTAIPRGWYERFGRRISGPGEYFEVRPVRPKIDPQQIAHSRALVALAEGEHQQHLEEQAERYLAHLIGHEIPFSELNPPWL